MGDRTIREELEAGQVELKRVTAELAVGRTPGFAEKKAEAVEGARGAREACAAAERDRDYAALGAERLTAEVSALSVSVAAKRAQNSPGLISFLATPLFVGAQIWLMAMLFTTPPLPNWVLPSLAPVPAFLLGFLWRKRLTSKPR